jgi:3-methyladenine DNA glycosylase/8-oxoguanine DNA glycosylase
LAADPLMAKLTAARPGLRVPGAWDGLEAAIRAILGQQITVAAAAKLAGKLVARYGKPLQQINADWPTLSHVFPAASRLAEADLAELGMPRARAASLSAIAQRSLELPTLFDTGTNLDETLGKLCSIPGIGNWTVQYLAIRLMREADAFPAQDVGLMRAIARLEGERPDAKQLLARAEAWRPWRAYAAQHLWTAEAAAG